MNSNDRRLTTEERMLDAYLKQYKYCIRRKKVLEKRRKEIVNEFENPLSGMSYDGMPRGSSSNVGCASLSFQLDEISGRIKEQLDQSVKVLTEIMETMEFLDKNSMEREIMECRYIDCMNWNDICNTINMARSPATRHWRKGLQKMLEFKRVQKIVKEYDQSKC